MPWSKLKNIIILLLLGVNVCLLALDLSRSVHANRLQARAREDVIAFLRDKGVQVRDELVPSSMELIPQIVQRDTQQEARLAAALLGEDAESEDRGAGVYRYFNEKGSIQFHSSGEFSAQFASGAFPAGDAAPSEHARRTLDLLDFQGELIASGAAEASQSFTFRQNWQGVPLFNCQATLNYRDGFLVGITGGRRLSGTPQPDRSLAVITVPTALMRFYTEMTSTLGDACREITGVTGGYVAAASIAGPVSMAPVWYISTDTGVCYQLDTVTGALTRA